MNVRFNGCGFIDVMDGDGYVVVTRVDYCVGAMYHVRLVVDVSYGRYAAYVTLSGGG